MNIAVRFPVKENLFLFYGLIALHLWVIVAAIGLLSPLWMIFLVILTVVASWVKTRQQYQRVTQAVDDLCWSGENWLMYAPQNQQHQNQNDVIYLQLIETSWVTSSFCFLKFEMNGEEKSWLFTRHGLGTRLFSELCYLTRLDISHQQIEPDN